MSLSKTQTLQNIFDKLIAHETRPLSQKGVGSKIGQPSRIQIKGAGVVPEDIFEQNPTDGGALVNTNHPLFATISIDDINQNQISDCYLLALLGSMANCPNGIAYIKQIVYSDPNDASKVVVVYTRNGLVTRIHCDLLVSPIQNRFADVNADLWVELIEKTYALFRRGADLFHSLDFGSSSAVAYDLGMEPAGYIILNDSVFNTIRQNLANQIPTTVATVPNAGIGLVGNHEYSITGINADNVITIRNPWGQPFEPVYSYIKPADFIDFANFTYVEYGTIPAAPDLQSQLDAANAQILKLKNIIANGIRSLS